MEKPNKQTEGSTIFHFQNGYIAYDENMEMHTNIPKAEGAAPCSGLPIKLVTRQTESGEQITCVEMDESRRTPLTEYLYQCSLAALNK